MNNKNQHIYSFFLFYLLLSSLTFSQSKLFSENIDKKEYIFSPEYHLHNQKIPLTMSLYSVPEKPDPYQKKLNYNVLAGVGAVKEGAGVTVHIYQRNAWWKDQRAKFHFQNDWDYALWVDKQGHFFAGAFLSHLFSSALQAGNVQSEPSALYGSILAFAYQTYVEIEDGFGPDWGFSPGDEAANFLGAGYTLSQFYFPFLKNFQFRFSYFPSKGPRFGTGTHGNGNMIDDYEGQKYWLTIRMKNLLPEKIGDFWPEFLCVAAGTGVKELGRKTAHREWYIALDFDAETIPLYGGFWQFLKNTLNYIHFPMPGIRITPNAAFFVFCY